MPSCQYRIRCSCLIIDTSISKIFFHYERCRRVSIVSNVCVWHIDTPISKSIFPTNCVDVPESYQNHFFHSMNGVDVLISYQMTTCLAQRYSNIKNILSLMNGVNVLISYQMFVSSTPTLQYQKHYFSL